MQNGVPLAKNLLAPLTTMASASAVDSDIQTKTRESRPVRAGKQIPLSILNEEISQVY